MHRFLTKFVQKMLKWQPSEWPSSSPLIKVETEKVSGQLLSLLWEKWMAPNEHWEILALSRTNKDELFKLSQKKKIGFAGCSRSTVVLDSRDNRVSKTRQKEERRLTRASRRQSPGETACIYTTLMPPYTYCLSFCLFCPRLYIFLSPQKVPGT